jgi:hypothetical protein
MFPVKGRSFDWRCYWSSGSSIIEKGSHSTRIKPLAAKAIIDKYTEDIATDGSLIRQKLDFVKPDAGIRQSGSEGGAIQTNVSVLTYQ